MYEVTVEILELEFYRIQLTRGWNDYSAQAWTAT
jgi:hypothetical protein